MVIQQKYGGSSDGAIASYDWTDIATNTGKEAYYLTNSAGSLYSWNSTINFSHDLVTSWSYDADGTAYVLDKEIDFDLLFGQPRTLRGEAFANVMMAADEVGGTYSALVKLIVKLRKWDGTTETEIISMTAEDVVGVGVTSGTSSRIIGVQGTVPVTHFKAGETLRVTMMFYSKSQNPGATHTSGTMYLGHDPANRVHAKFVTTSHDRIDTKIILPFRIDV